MIQLKGHIKQLHSLIPPEPGKVQSINFLRHEEVRKCPSLLPRAQAPLAVIKGRTWWTVFTHGDLGSHNILWGTKQSGDCCNHRLGIFGVVSGVLGIHEGILWACHTSERLWVVGDATGVH
jgi:hypothetical protein